MTDLEKAEYFIDTVAMPEYFTFMKSKVGENALLNQLEKKFIAGKTDENFYDQLKVITRKLLKEGSQYFEANTGVVNITTFDKATLIGAMQEWYQTYNRKKLYILVVCSTKNEIEKIADLAEITDLYGENHKDWQPYKKNNTTNNIAELLQEYHEFTRIPFEGWFVNAFDWTEDEIIDDLRDDWSKRMILITDGIALLKPENTTIKEIFNNNEDIGGFMLPLCSKMKETAKNYILAGINTQLYTTYRRFYKSWKRAFVHIELEIPTKDMFFRRLTNFAKRMEITSISEVSEFKDIKQKKGALSSITND